MDRRSSAEDDDSLYDYLLEAGGVLNDVRTVAESVVSSSSISSWSAVTVTDSEDEARRIADRLLEENAEVVERAVDEIVRHAAESGRLAVDFRWPPQPLDLLRPGRPPRDVLRVLNALLRLPFTYDTYAGTYFHKLVKGLERTVTVDALFVPTVRVYAKLVDAAPDSESAVESFGSLCQATRALCMRHADFAKSVTSVCLLARCLSAVCRRGAGSKNVKQAVVEFVAAVVGADPDGGPYAVLCCADPTARWFDPVAKYYSCRSAFFQCLDGDRTLLKRVVSSFFHWITEPRIPVGSETTTATATAVDVAVRYACSLHAVHLLAKMLEYRAGRNAFPVRVSKTVRIHAVDLSDYCLGFLSANRGRVPATLAGGLCKLVAAVAAFDVRVVESVVAAVNAPEFGVRVLADVHGRRADAAAFAVQATEREDAVDELFEKRRWQDDDAYTESLVRLATALSGRHEWIWRLITRSASFFEAVAARADDDARSLMANIRCTPLGGTLTYDFADGRSDRHVDWSDPRQRLLFGVACASDRGRCWLNAVDAFASLNRFVRTGLDEAGTRLDPDDGGRKRLDTVVDVAYSYCASAEGLRFVLDDTVRGTAVTELYHLSYRQFDDDNRFEIDRDALVMLWLRLIEAATHTFSLRVYADSKLNYQETLSKLAAENRTENGTVFLAETTDLLTKLQRPISSAVPATSRENASVAGASSSSAADRRGRRFVIRSDRTMSGTDMIDLIISFGRRRFGDHIGSSDGAARRLSDVDLTDFDVTGIRLALRYGSTVAGLVASEESASELQRIYGSVERRAAPGSFNCTICTLFMASQGSRNKCVEAYAVVLKLGEGTRFVWPPSPDADEDAADRRAAFGHLVEGLLQRESPEVYNAFKMSGVSWWLLCSGWASDCFWGRLGWPEICRWMCLVVTFPADYQAFFFLCLAAARRRRWLEAFNLGRFHETVYREDFGDFRLADHADYLEGLAKKYQRSLSTTLVSEFDSS